ncbi:MAG: hypothetical protein OXH20_05790 [bacterium]|nr:hypothetical protein [bacterium]MDE0667929.1 hypothetical protein [bacterium]
MAITRLSPRPAWTLAEAKARLSEILRLSKEEGRWGDKSASLPPAAQRRLVAAITGGGRA